MSGPELGHFSTPTLSIACEVSGPAQGRPTLLLHGWPDDARTWDRVLPALHAAGNRTIVPYLRGCGPTRFRSPQIPRNGQLVALGQDVLELADAMELQTFAVVGHDWGARAAYIASALAPDRVTHCVALSVGWGTNDPGQRLPLKQVQNYWYHWYMALDHGAALVREERRDFTRYIWTIWNPGWSIPTRSSRRRPRRSTTRTGRRSCCTPTGYGGDWRRPIPRTPPRRRSLRGTRRSASRRWSS